MPYKRYFAITGEEDFARELKQEDEEIFALERKLVGIQNPDLASKQVLDLILQLADMGSEREQILANEQSYLPQEEASKLDIQLTDLPWINNGITSMYGRPGSKNNPIILPEIIVNGIRATHIDPEQRSSFPTVYADDLLGRGQYNVAQAAYLNIGKDTVMEANADALERGIMLYTAAGATPLAVISTIETAPVWIPVAKQLFAVETNVAAGGADFAGQMIANDGDLSKWNVANTAGATFLGTGLGSIAGGILDISYNSVIEDSDKTIFHSPLNPETLKSIGFNVLGGVIGGKAETQYLKNLTTGGMSTMGTRFFSKLAGQMTGAIPAAVFDEITKPKEKPSLAALNLYSAPVEETWWPIIHDAVEKNEAEKSLPLWFTLNQQANDTVSSNAKPYESNSIYSTFGMGLPGDTTKQQNSSLAPAGKPKHKQNHKDTSAKHASSTPHSSINIQSSMSHNIQKQHTKITKEKTKHPGEEMAAVLRAAVAAGQSHTG